MSKYTLATYGRPHIMKTGSKGTGAAKCWFCHNKAHDNERLNKVIIDPRPVSDNVLVKFAHDECAIKYANYMRLELINFESQEV